MLCGIVRAGDARLPSGLAARGDLQTCLDVFQILNFYTLSIASNFWHMYEALNIDKNN
jgi:hypothetical protein